MSNIFHIPKVHASETKPKNLRTKEHVINDVRVSEDNLARLIEKFQGGTMTNGGMIYAMREIRMQLKRATDIDELTH